MSRLFPTMERAGRGRPRRPCRCRGPAAGRSSALAGALASGALVLDRRRPWAEQRRGAAGAAGHRAVDGRRGRAPGAGRARRPARHRPRGPPSARGPRGHRPGRVGTVPQLRDRAPLAARTSERARPRGAHSSPVGPCSVGGWRAASPSWVMPFARPPTMSPATNDERMVAAASAHTAVGQRAAGRRPVTISRTRELGVAEDEDRPVGLVEGAVQPQRVGAGVLLRRRQVDREGQARRLLGDADRPLQPAAVARGQLVTSEHWHRPRRPRRWASAAAAASWRARLRARPRSAGPRRRP